MIKLHKGWGRRRDEHIKFITCRFSLFWSNQQSFNYFFSFSGLHFTPYHRYQYHIGSCISDFKHWKYYQTMHFIEHSGMYAGISPLGVQTGYHTRPHHPVMAARDRNNRRQSIFMSFCVTLSNTTKVSSSPCKDTRVQGSANVRRMPAMIAHLTWMIYQGQSRTCAHHALQPRIMKLVKMLSCLILW